MSGEVRASSEGRSQGVQNQTKVVRTTTGTNVAASTSNGSTNKSSVPQRSTQGNGSSNGSNPSLVQERSNPRNSSTQTQATAILTQDTKRKEEVTRLQDTLSERIKSVDSRLSGASGNVKQTQEDLRNSGFFGMVSGQKTALQEQSKAEEKYRDKVAKEREELLKIQSSADELVKQGQYEQAKAALEGSEEEYLRNMKYASKSLQAGYQSTNEQMKIADQFLGEIQTKTKQVGVIAAATIATGGVASAGFLAAVVAGTVAGTGVGAVGNFTQAAVDDRYSAKDALKDTGKDALTSFQIGFGGGTGAAVGKAVIGQAGKQIAGQVVKQAAISTGRKVAAGMLGNGASNGMGSAIQASIGKATGEDKRSGWEITKDISIQTIVGLFTGSFAAGGQVKIDNMAALGTSSILKEAAIKIATEVAIPTVLTTGAALVEGKPLDSSEVLRDVGTNILGAGVSAKVVASERAGVKTAGQQIEGFFHKTTPTTIPPQSRSNGQSENGKVQNNSLGGQKEIPKQEASVKPPSPAQPEKQTLPSQTNKPQESAAKPTPANEGKTPGQDEHQTNKDQAPPATQKENSKQEHVGKTAGEKQTSPENSSGTTKNKSPQEQLNIKLANEGFTTLEGAQGYVDNIEQMKLLSREFWQGHTSNSAEAAQIKNNIRQDIKNSASSGSLIMNATGVQKDGTFHRQLERVYAAYQEIAREEGYGVSRPIYDPKINRVKITLKKGGVKKMSPKLYEEVLKTIQPDLKQSDLFPGGVKQLEFAQGPIGDCYFLSGVYSAAKHPTGEQLLSKMITIKPDGSFKVVFPGYPDKPIYLTPTQIRDLRGVNGPPGVKILERAYSELRRKTENNRGKESRKTALEGGFGHDALKALTGEEQRWCDSSGKTDMTAQKNYGDLNTFANNSNPEISKKAIRLLDQLSIEKDKFVVTANTPNENYAPHRVIKKKIINGQSSEQERSFMDRQERFLAQHAYSITEIDSSKKTVTLVDPHDTQSKRYVLTYDEFLKYFCSFSGAKRNNLQQAN